MCDITWVAELPEWDAKYNDNKTKNIIKDLFCAVEEIEVEDEESETEIWLREQNERLRIEVKRLKEDLKELSNLVYGKESKKN